MKNAKIEETAQNLTSTINEIGIKIHVCGNPR